ncbi:MAG: transglutaminase domain-containing protein [Clostridiales bacterium]|nr:transglutaminase domain-containing protein [Clostridiales bacterium]
MLKAKRSRFAAASLVLALAFAGCAQQAETGTTDMTVTDPATTETQDTLEIVEPPATQEFVPFEFDPHAYSAMLETCYSEEYRDSFFNLCDALQEGKTTFECSSEEVYKWCMDPVTLNQLYPVAVMQLETSDGGYSDGTGHFSYKKSVEEYLARQEEFQNDVTDIMNSYIRSDYTDFEKCLALYDYIDSNYTYDHDGEVGKTQDGSGYTCYKLKKGICCDIGAWYAYLLMECGVNAIEVQNWGTEDSLGYHAWTFVEIDGRGYHIDATWGLKSEYETGNLIMDYFMMTDSDRAESGYLAEDLQVPILPYFYAKDCPDYDFTASDTRYRLPYYSSCESYDTDLNIIYYREGYYGAADEEFVYE